MLVVVVGESVAVVVGESVVVKVVVVAVLLVNHGLHISAHG